MMRRALMMVFYSCFIVLGFNCRKDCAKSEKCKIEAESGPCMAAYKRYYYDQKDKKCKEFTWGGCGKEYFKTKEECKKECGCK